MMIKMLRYSLSLSVLGFVQTLQAAEEKVITEGTAGGTEVMTAASLMQMMAGLLLVIALIFIISWLMRRVSGVTAGHGGKMKVLAGLPLGPRDRLVLVKVGDKQILLGTSPGRINTLYVFDEPVIEDNEPEGDFALKLKEIVTRGRE